MSRELGLSPTPLLQDCTGASIFKQLFWFLVVLSFELRASRRLGRHSYGLSLAFVFNVTVT
jgi:hypothetical protein